MIRAALRVDGGRSQGRETNPDTQSRWREDKVLTVGSSLPGDRRGIRRLPADGGQREPEPLVTTHMATARDGQALGEMARVQAERRGYRGAEVVIGTGGGGNWIDPLFGRASRLHARVIDWRHAVEHVWDCAKAAHGDDGPRAAQPGERLEAPPWDGRTGDVIATLGSEAERLGEPRQDVGYFTRHAGHVNYPEFRRRGWPIGSGVTEAGVKQFNKRVKGTEQFRTEAGVETILISRGAWISQDERWERYWATRAAYVN